MDDSGDVKGREELRQAMSHIGKVLAPKVSWLLSAPDGDGACRIWERFARVREAVIRAG